MGAQRRQAATGIGLAFALFVGGGVMASPGAKGDVKIDVAKVEQRSPETAAGAGCGNLSDSHGAVPGWFVERCMEPRQRTDEVSSLAPDASRGPILVQEVSTDTVRSSSVAGIATLTTFGTLVPGQATDFPADFIRLPSDTQRVYQLTVSGAASRYTTGGVNSVLPSIPPAGGSTWADMATDPTTGTVYGVAIVGACASSTLSTINFASSTSVPIGTVTGGGCIAALAADNAGNLFGIDIVADTLISINKVTGAGTVVGSIGFNTNFGQAMDCDPASGTCYMFTINVTAGNTTELRSVNTATGATAFVGTIGSTSPGGAPQVAGAVFETITDTCAVDADCADGNLCNGVETCVATVCTAGTPVTCPDDGQFCTIDTCVPANGQCGVPNTCGDGDTCTVDSCDEVGNVCNHATPAPVVFCNAAAITIPAGGAGSPYPSPIVVSGLGNSAALCSVQLLGITHTWPDDIDVLLVGPVATTQNAEIMSDVGGSVDIVGVNLTLRDSAATSLPDSTVLTTGTFKPTNIGATADVFPAPAPAANVSSALTVFSGNPNGTWNLYVNDQFTPDAGSMSGGWCVSIVPTGCTTNADCNDGNPCTDDTCTNNVCSYANNTAACSDGNACTLNDACSGGVCVGGTPQVCDDGDACTSNNCNTGTGQCQYPGIVCDDSNACTDDTCNSGTGCVFTADDTNACTDNNLCTTPDVCQNGACVGQNPVVCTPDANVCTTEACNPATGNCVSTNNTNACDDNNICTTGDTCGPTFSENFDGETAPNLPITWTTSATGDGLAWESSSTSSDTAPNSAFGFDGPGPTPSDEVLISPPINIATATATLSFRNRWSFENTTTTCYDAGVLEIDIAGGGFVDIVTAGGSFVTGGYTGTVSAAFSNPLAGRAAWCTNSAGYPAYLTTLVNLPAAAAGQTIQLQWHIGTDVSVGAPGQNIDSIVILDGTHVCNPGSATDCNDNNPCTDDSCDTITGCVYANNTDSCDDGSQCTILDQCAGGNCGGTAVVCDDSNPCTLDTCNPGSGCNFAPITAPPETQNVAAASDKTTYTWSPAAFATQYDVVRGSMAAYPVGPGGGDEFCFGNLPGTTLSDPVVPAPGFGNWYLSRGKNSCGNGTYGNQGVLGAPGALRVTTTCP